MYKETVYNNPVEASGDGPNIKKNRNATWSFAFPI
jgi:hypothetical protein